MGTYKVHQETLELTHSQKRRGSGTIVFRETIVLSYRRSNLTGLVFLTE